MRVGNLVECTNDKFTQEQITLISNRPVKGNIYEVRKTLLTRNGPAVLLEELRNELLLDPTSGFSFEPSFRNSRFTVIDNSDIKTTIEHLNTNEQWIKMN